MFDVKLSESSAQKSSRSPHVSSLQVDIIAQDLQEAEWGLHEEFIVRFALRTESRGFGTRVSTWQ